MPKNCGFKKVHLLGSGLVEGYTVGLKMGYFLVKNDVFRRYHKINLIGSWLVGTQLIGQKNVFFKVKKVKKSTIFAIWSKSIY